MKKLLLLLMAILLFAPPRAKAQDKTTTKVVTILDAQSGNSNWITVSGEGALNDYVYYIKDKNYIGNWSNNNVTWTPYYAENGNNVLQLRYNNSTDSKYQVLPPTLNKFYVDFKLNDDWGGCKISKTQNPSFYFDIEAGTEIKFYPEGVSKISGVELRTADVAELSNLTAVDNTATKAEADGKATFTAANGSEFITIKNSGSGNVRLTGIVVSVEEPALDETVVRNVSIDNITINDKSIAKFDKAKKTIYVYGNPLSSIITLPTADETTKIIPGATGIAYNYVYADKDRATQILSSYQNASTLLATYPISIPTEASSDLFVDADQSSKSADQEKNNTQRATYSWVKNSPNVPTIPLYNLLPTVDDYNKLGADGEIKLGTLRFIAFNATSVSKESLDIDIVLKKIPAPTVNLEKTNAIEGQEYDPASKTLKYEGNNPIVYFNTAATPANATTDATNLSRVLQTISTINGINPVAPTKAGTNISASLYEPDGTFKVEGTVGQSTPIKVQTWFFNSYNMHRGNGGPLYQDSNNGSPVTINVQKVKPQPKVNIVGGVRTTTLTGGVYGYLEDNLKVTLSIGSGDIQYQYIPTSTDIFAQIPEADWTDYSNGTEIEIGVGRLFMRVKGETEYTYKDFKKIDATSVFSLNRDNLLGLSDAATAITISEPVRVIGFFPLSDDNTKSVYLMFVADKGKNVLRVHIEGNEKDIKKFEEAYKGYKLLDGLTGVLRKNKEMPELYVNSPSLDYSAFISEPYDAPEGYPAYEPEFVQRVPEIADYSKLMYFGPLRWNATEKTFYDNKNNTVKLYQRIATGQTVEEFEKQLIDGVQYRIAGYVGYAEGAPVILPRAYVAAPLLRAPNPINDEAMPDTLIEMNVISNELELSVRSSITTADGVEHNLITEGTKLQYILCDDTEAVMENDSRWNNAKSIEPLNGETITITTGTEENKGELADGGCTIAARLAAGTMRSGVVTVRFNKVKVEDTFDNIADFKTAANNIQNLPSLDSNIDDETHTFYQYTGYARVREITPNYIYIRTTDKDGNLLDDVDADESKDLDEDAKQNRSNHSILIYNENGWNQDVISIDKDGNNVTGTRAPLQVGDIITNFALIPTQSGFGNLVANATDFIRTFRRLDGVTGGTVKPVELNAQDNNVPAFTEADRMLRYSIKNVTISRTANNGAGIQRDVPADDQDATSYTYTLNIPGKPILDNGSVFDANPDLDVMYSENALFNLEGVVMLYKGDIPEGQDGRYMLALKPESFAFSNVATPRAPRITLSGVGAKDGTFVTKATVTLESTTAENSENAVILYTKDGSDPRLSSSKRITYTGPFEIDANTVVKAYVRSNGTPNSELADTLFTRTAVDTRYIMNFISQAQENTPYHLTATAKVVAKGGEYFFLRGTQGHYLPVKDETGNRAIVNNLSAGDYVNDMVITPHIINGNLRGGHVEADHKDLFGAKISKPANIDEIEAEPDEVYTITTANARRYVKIMDVKLTGEEFNDEGDELSTHDTQWKLTTNKGEGKDIRVNHNILEPSFNWDDKDQSAAAYYDITGFAMIGDDGEIELWPTEVEKIKTSVAVRASFDKNATNTGIQADGNYNVTFYPYTVVRLTAVEGATIYYQITDTDAPEEVKEGRWNVYGHEFAVTKNCYIHAYSVAPGYEESGHTHIYMTLGKGDDTQDPANMSGRLVITHQFNEEDVPVITIKPEDNTLAAGTYDIYYTTDGSTPTVDPKNLYKGPFEMPGGGVVLAILKEAAKELPGKVASLNVWYVPTGIDGIDSDRTDSDAVRAEGGNIIAPEGSEVYDLSGRRVNATGLRRGIYIVRVPGAAKAVKIKVD